MRKMSFEKLVEKYRDIYDSEGEEALAIVRVGCARLMRAYGLEWNDDLESYLRTVAIYYPYSGTTFIDFFLQNAKHNFKMPDTPLYEERAIYTCTGYTYFRLHNMSQEESLLLNKFDKQLEKKRRSEERVNSMELDYDSDSGIFDDEYY